MMPADPARAETEPESSSEPGVVDEKLRQERREKELQERLQRPPPRIEQEPEGPKPPPLPEARLLLKDVILRGRTVLPERVFEPIIAPYRNRDVTVNDLQALADAIQQEYRRRGYVTTVAFLPPQRIEEGRATIEVLEGRMGEVVVEGNRYFTTRRVLWYWPLDPGEVLRYDTVRRSLVRINEHPDRQVQALMRAGKVTGQTDVVLKVKDHLPLHLGTQWDSQGTKSIGRNRYGVSLRHTNLLGIDDQAALGMVFSSHLGAVYTQYSVPLSPHGTSAAFGFSHSQVSPKRHFTEFGINGTSQTYTTSLTQSLWETERVSLSAQAGFDIKESRTKVQSGTSRRDRLRVLRVGPRLAVRDAWGRWMVDNECAFGLKAFGATSENNPLASRPGADPDFFKMELRMSRVQRMPWDTQLVVSLETQVSPSKLTPQEELYLGGAATVRGYPEGDYLADQGIVARVDYLVPVRVLPEAWRQPGSEIRMQDIFQLVGFVDRGYGRLRAITREEQSSRNLMGLGLGLAFREYLGLSGRLEWAFNVGDDPLTDDSPSRLHFQLAHEF